jgi:hypothetical protein
MVTLQVKERTLLIEISPEGTSIAVDVYPTETNNVLLPIYVVPAVSIGVSGYGIKVLGRDINPFRADIDVLAAGDAVIG